MLLRSSGITLRQGSELIPLATKAATDIGPFTIIHSHDKILSGQNKREFLVGGKYFCPGCYGLSLGILIALPLPILYLSGTISSRLFEVLIFAAPFCYLPLLLNIRKWKFLPLAVKFIFYGLLPIGITYPR
jgi:hypothetical protein